MHVPLDSGRLQRIAALLESTACAFGVIPEEQRDALLKNGLPRDDSVFEELGAQLGAATAAVLESVDGVDLATRLLEDLSISCGSMPHS